MKLVDDVLATECLVVALNDYVAARIEQDQCNSWGNYGKDCTKRLERTAATVGDSLNKLIKNHVLSVLMQKGL